MVFFYTQNRLQYVDTFIYELASSSPLGKYPIRWFISQYYDSFGFIPLRDEFFDFIKDSNNLDPEHRFIRKREILVMKELNSNANKSFKDIDRDTGLSAGSADYSYHKLKKEGFVKRVTITSTMPRLRFNALLMMEIIKGLSFSKCRPILLKEVMKDNGSLSKYTFTGDISVPNGAILCMPVSDENSLQSTEDYIKTSIAGTRLRTLTIKKITIGTLCYRRFDPVYSNQYRLLLRDKMIDRLNETDYEATGRTKKKQYKPNFIIDLPDK